MPAATARGQSGQALVLFTILVTGMIAIAAIVFDGAAALVVRRTLQNSADAAALAGANLIQSGDPRGCSGNSSSSPRPVVLNAVQAALAVNLAGVPIDSTTITCPGGYQDYAVRVELEAPSVSFFGGFLGHGDFTASASATAVNGGLTASKFSVVELNPYNAGWGQGRGCPSVLFSGGPTVVFDGSLQINSACPASQGGGLGTNGNSATITFNNGAQARIVGGYSPGVLTISPRPLTSQPSLRDPLAGLPPLPVSGLPVRRNGRLVINNQSLILEPGVYRGGIQLRNSSQAFLRPGIYVLDGGGLDVGAQASVYTIRATGSSSSSTTWGTDCPASACGVLIYSTGGSTLGPITVGAGATVQLRPYSPSFDGTGANVREYENLLIWQDRNPVPTASYSQPRVTLNGGGDVELVGTVYAPSAEVYLTGGSGGSGGSSVDVTLQFISWDLQIQGNSSFHFIYQSEHFAKPLEYGLVE